MLLKKTRARKSKTTFVELLSKADAARDAGLWPDAARLYADTISLRPDDAPIRMQYGHALKESGELKEAEAAYLSAIKIEPDADSYLQLGHLYKLMHRPDLAEQNYLQSLTLDLTSADARSELIDLGWTAARLRGRLGKDELGVEGSYPQGSDSGAIAFELSDLVDFLQHARYPTGIQRVQLELAEVLRHTEHSVHYVYFDNTSFMFNEISHSQVKRIVDLVTDEDRSEDTRRSYAERIRMEIRSGVEFEFQQNTNLVNVGTSWGYQNYFLVIRDIKRRFGVKYIPLVHDTIPLIFPEFCDQNLVTNFISWIDGMTEHADMVLANSQNTLNDLTSLAERLSQNLPPSRLLLLNGEFRARDGKNLDEKKKALAVLRSHNLDVDDYVLMVSTIEPRKNHMLAFNAWSRMLKTRERASIPYLVCVGAPGWMNEALYTRLERDEDLAERIIILRNVSDQTLNQLYDRAQFTIFPSLYEGWGLPISEALAHGKVPLVSNVSAHPEAGGEHAVYFDLGSEADFQTKLEDLIDDVPSRQHREAAIKTATPLKPWSDICADLVNHLNYLETEANQDAPPAPQIVSGRYYSMGRNMERRISRLGYRAEQFRTGLNWEELEEWGCWVRGGTAELRLTLPDEGDAFQFYLYLSTPPLEANTANISIAVPEAKWTLQTQAGSNATFWRSFKLNLEPGAKREISLRLVGSTVVDFRTLSEGRDHRESAFAMRGIFVAHADNDEERRSLMEAIQFKDLKSISLRFQKQATITS
jgi:glycosyltransferase involved in cell wall biosynthesis